LRGVVNALNSCAESDTDPEKWRSAAPLRGETVLIESRGTFARNHLCRQIFERRVCLSWQAAQRQNRLQRLMNFAIATDAGERRDYAHALIAPRHGSSSARLLAHATISKAKPDAW
jgi:hypothetical protein